MGHKHLHIAVGIIRNAQREIFLTQRQAGSHLAGYWEFPGGKVEVGEKPEEALRRELLEETGITATHCIPLKMLDYNYTERDLTLHFFLVEEWEGEPYGREQQPMRWVAQSELQMADFPDANQPIIKLLLADAHSEQQK